MWEQLSSDPKMHAAFGSSKAVVVGGNCGAVRRRFVDWFSQACRVVD